MWSTGPRLTVKIQIRNQSRSESFFDSCSFHDYEWPWFTELLIRWPGVFRHNNLWLRSNSALCTWRSPAAATGGRPAGVLSSGSGCRTSSCPESESGLQRRACSPSQLRQRTEHLLSLHKNQNIKDFYTVRILWVDLTECNDAGQQVLTES